MTFREWNFPQQSEY